MEQHEDSTSKQEGTRRDMTRLGESSLPIKGGNGPEGSQTHINIVFNFFDLSRSSFGHTILCNCSSRHNVVVMDTFQGPFWCVQGWSLVVSVMGIN